MAYVSKRRQSVQVKNNNVSNVNSGYVSERRKRVIEGSVKPAENNTPIQQTPVQKAPEQAAQPRQNTPAYLSGGDYKDQLIKPEDLRTPLDQSRYKLVGSNMLPRYKEDTPLQAIGKDIINYGVGTAGRIVGAPQQAIMQADRAAVNAVRGKPQDFSQMNFAKDILGADENNVLANMAGMVLDPATYIGGGIVDDLTKAGMMGRAAKASTEQVVTRGAQQAKVLAKQAVKKTATKQTAEQQLQDEITTPNPARAEQIAEELRNAEPIKKPTVDELWNKNNPAEPVKPPDETLQTKLKQRQLEALKRIRMTAKKGTVEHTALTERINKLESKTQSLASPADAGQVNVPPAVETAPATSPEGIKVYRGYALSENAAERNLSKPQSIMDVIGHPQQEVDLLPFEYYTESTDVASKYANRDNAIIEAIMKQTGKTKDEAIKTFSTLYGKSPVFEGKVKEHTINPKKVLDLTGLGETPNYNDVIKKLLKSEGSEIPVYTKGENVNAPKWDRWNQIERDMMQDISEDSDAFPVYYLMKSKGANDKTGRNFVNWLNQNGYDAVRYSEDGTNHYAILDNAAKAETPPTKSQGTPMLERTPANVGTPKVKSYAFENPEVKPYYQDYAQWILDNEYVPNEQLDRVTEVMTKIKADTGLQPAQVKDAMERIVKDAGHENVAAAKRAEIVIDDMLTNGFTTVEGEKVPANLDYIGLKSKIEGKEIKPRPEQTLDDMPVPESNYAKPANIAESVKPDAELVIPTTEGQKKFVKEYTEQFLPDDEAGLTKTIADLEEQVKVEKDESKLLRINLQLFAANEKLKAVSQFRTNTIERSTMLQDAKDFLPEEDFEYTPERAKDWQAQAELSIKNSPDIAKERILKAKQLDKVQEYEAAIISKQLLDRARETGDYKELSKWLSTTATKTRESARALKAVDMAWDKTSPEAGIKRAQRIIDGTEDAIEKTDSQKIAKVKKESKEATDKVNKAKKESADKAIKEVLPEEILSKRISDTLKESKAPESNPLNDMVNELFKVAKESPLPSKEEFKKDPIQWLKDAIQNKSQYADVWEKAKVIVENKFQDDEGALQVLNDYFDKGIIPPYSEKTFTQSMDAGMKSLGQKISELVYVTSTDKQKAIQDLTDLLIKETGATGDDAALLASKISNRYTQLFSEKSRNILESMVRERKIAVKKGDMERIDELINLGAFDDAEIANLIKEKNGIPVLTNEDIAEIDRLYSEAAKHPEGSYKNRMFTQKARTLVEDKIPSGFIDKFRVIQRLSMIFNPKTLITRNPGGNILLMSITQIKENTLGAFIDMLTSAIRRSERTTLFAPIEKGKAMLQGAAKGATEWAKDIKYKVDTNPTHGQMELQTSKVFQGSGPVSRILNELDIIEKRLLQIGDRPFYEAAYAARVAELKRIKKVAEITDEMKVDARVYALDKVFQNDSELSKIFSGAKNLSQKPLFKVLANLIMPFSQTPANILDKMIEYGPGGIIKALVNSKKSGVFNQKYFVDNLASGLTGTGILALGYYMASKKLITGKPDMSAKARDFKTMVGQGNYALRFGGNYYTIDWAQPVATMLLAGAQGYFGGANGEDEFKKVLNSLEAGGDTFFNMSLLKNVSSLFGTGNSPMGSLINTLLGTTTQFTPTMGKQISQLIDPYVRETYDPNMLKQQYNKILARLPWASETLPIKTDLMGEDIKSYQGKNNVLNVMFNPGFYTEDKATPAQKEMLRLYDSGAAPTATDVFPSALPSSVTDPSTKIKYTLTADQMNKYKKLYGEITLNGLRDSRGNVLRSGLDSIINSASYKALSDQNKAKKISSILTNAKDRATAEILKELK
jgi:hypothetical protein